MSGGLSPGDWGVRNAIADVRNGSCELFAAIVESRDKATLQSLKDVAESLSLELSAAASAAEEKLRSA